MRIFTFIVAVVFIGCNSKGQIKIISFPALKDFVPVEYAKTNNLIPIAILDLSKEGIYDKIPISYSMLNSSVDSSNFLVKGDFIDKYSFKIQSDGKFLPLFTLNALKLPNNLTQYLNPTLSKVDSAKKNIDLAAYIKFYPEPQWWQNDASPLTDEGKPMKFICQIELVQITEDDCCLYIFYDSQNKIVKQIYQRD